MKENIKYEIPIKISRALSITTWGMQLKTSLVNMYSLKCIRIQDIFNTDDLRI